MCVETNAVRLVANYERGPLKRMALSTNDKKIPDGFFRSSYG